MTPAIRILHLEDTPTDAELAARMLTREGGPYSVNWVDSAEGFEQGLKDPDLALVLVDYNIPGFDGPGAIAMAGRLRPDLPVILLSGSIGEELAVECLKHGAVDYVLKDNMRHLPNAVKRALAESSARKDRQRAEEEKESLLEAATTAKVVPWKRDLATKVWVLGNSCQEVLGYSSQELKADISLLESLIHGEDLHRLSTAQRRARKGNVAGFDCRMLHRSGNWLWTRWTLSLGEGWMRGVLQDLSELHATQDQLIQSQKAETTGVLVSGISHDFNNLLQAILAGTELMESTPLSLAQQKYLATIRRATLRSQDLIRQLLGFARKNMDAQRTVQSPNELVNESADLLRQVILRDITIEKQLTEDLPAVEVIPGQIVQLLLNLGINAKDAIGEEGTIIFRTGLERLGDEEAEAHNRVAGCYVFVEVEDNGQGIPPDILGRIYDPFFTTKPKGKGTGLGLAMAQAITNGHDGILTCHSEVGVGTRFRILLPCQAAGAAS